MALPSCRSVCFHTSVSCKMFGKGKRDFKKMMASLKESQAEAMAPVAKRPAAGGSMKRPAAFSTISKRPAAADEAAEEEGKDRQDTQVVPYGQTRSRNKSTWLESHKNEMDEDVMASCQSLQNVTAKTNSINNAVVELTSCEKYW